MAVDTAIVRVGCAQLHPRSSLTDGSLTAVAPFDISYGRLAVLADGSPVLGTSFAGSASLNGTTVTASSAAGDIVLAKLGEDLSVASTWQASANRSGALTDLAADTHGHLTFVSSIYGAVTIGGNNVNPIDTDALIVKLDWTGTAAAPLWHQLNTGSGDQLGNRIDVNAAGEALVLGSFATTTSLATGIFLDEDTSLDVPVDFFLQRREP